MRAKNFDLTCVYVCTGADGAIKSELFVSSTDLEGKASQEDLITQEAASKSVHVLGQGTLTKLQDTIEMLGSV